MKNESRAFLIKWLNSLYIPLQRIEEIGKGVALCTLLRKIDAAFPSFKKDPITENDYFNNLKLVQIYFEKKGVKICFPIDKMIKLKMQDNLEAIQAIYRYACKEAPGLCINNPEPVISSPLNTSSSDITINDNEKSLFTSRNEPIITTQLNEQIQELKEQNHGLYSLTEKLKDCATIMQNERNFYFEKLVQIEKHLTDSEAKEITKEKILRILYKV